MDVMQARQHQEDSMQKTSTRSDNPIEFDRIVSQVRQSRLNSGAGQAACVASTYGTTFGYDPAELLTAAERDGSGIRWG
jgi:hypothetical protein